MSYIRAGLLIGLLITLLLGCSKPDGGFPIEHPIKTPPVYTEKVRCDNCGMDRNRYARTRYEFDTGKGKFHTCSIYCVVVMGRKLGEKPVNVRVAEYLHPERMIDADRAFYVVGSKAPGTMTRVSKPAFPNKAEAEGFIGKYGGVLTDYRGAVIQTEKEIGR